jgi:hypothetical protein
MSIDRIGKGGAGVPAPGIGTTSPSSSASEVGGAPAEFKVKKGDASEPISKPPLEQLRAGEISISKYLDIKVDEATSHLDRRLSGEQLSFVRDNLRQQLSNDPVLADLVKSTTGMLPPPTE